MAVDMLFTLFSTTIVHLFHSFFLNKYRSERIILYGSPMTHAVQDVLKCIQKSNQYPRQYRSIEIVKSTRTVGRNDNVFVIICRTFQKIASIYMRAFIRVVPRESPSCSSNLLESGTLLARELCRPKFFSTMTTEHLPRLFVFRA